MWEPFGSAPANSTASWRGGPDERGTLSILTTCIITLLLCAYTSLHLDIPKKGKTGWAHQLWRRTLWVILGLGAPEIVAFFAFRQLVFARHLQVKMEDILTNLIPSRKLHGSHEDVELGTLPVTVSNAISDQVGDTQDAQVDPNSDLKARVSSGRSPEWTRVHSFFAIMGGFVFEEEKNKFKIMDQGRQRATLTSLGVRKIAAHTPGPLLALSKDGIVDKSKANGFAKFLVCVQACWFLAQTVGRLTTGLPISLLEMNTLLHAVCCLFIYLAWWQKPLDIDEPHIIDASHGYFRKVCAWMLVKDSQRENGHVWSYKTVNGVRTMDALRCRLVYEDDLGNDQENKSLQRVRSQIAAAREYNRKAGRPGEAIPGPRTSPAEAVDLYPGQKLHGFVLYDTDVYKNDEQDRCAYAHFTPAIVERLKLAQILRLEDAAAGTWKFGDQSTVPNSDGKLLKFGSSFTISADRDLKYARHAKKIKPDYLLWAGVLLSGCVYGGVHLLAWNGPFPTRAQRILWRTSCFIIASPIGLIMLALALGLALIIIIGLGAGIWACVSTLPAIGRFGKWLGGTFHDLVDWLFDQDWFVVIFLAAIGLSLLALALIYMAARVYLMVECFINIAHLPGAVFQEPRWSQYIPHFGAG